LLSNAHVDSAAESVAPTIAGILDSDVETAMPILAVIFRSAWDTYVNRSPNQEAKAASLHAR
jgi:hypothetical protein